MRLFSANEGTLEPYLSQFDVEKLEMASVMGICGSLVGPKSENVEKVLVFKAFLKGQRCDGDPGAGLQRSEPDRLGGGRGRVNLPPRRLVWRFCEVWVVCCLVGASTRLEARGLGGFMSYRLVSDPNGSINRIYSLSFQDGPKDAKKTSSRASRGTWRG